MQKFFDNIDSIDQFTRSLDCHGDRLICERCSASGQFVSHGFVYKQRYQAPCEPVGKRILCSNRYGRSGCGSTVQLYVASEIPSLHYGAVHVFIYISALLASLTVEVAYQKAVHLVDPRQAWRWLSRLISCLTVYRCRLRSAPPTVSTYFNLRSHRLRLLLPTLERLFTSSEMKDCSAYQLYHQVAFL